MVGEDQPELGAAGQVAAQEGQEENREIGLPGVELLQETVDEDGVDEIHDLAVGPAPALHAVRPAPRVVGHQEVRSHNEHGQGAVAPGQDPQQVEQAALEAPAEPAQHLPGGPHPQRVHPLQQHRHHLHQLVAHEQDAVAGDAGIAGRHLCVDHQARVQRHYELVGQAVG